MWMILPHVYFPTTELPVYKQNICTCCTITYGIQRKKRVRKDALLYYLAQKMGSVYNFQ